MRRTAAELITASFLAWCCLTPLSEIYGTHALVQQTNLSDLEIEVMTWTQDEGPHPLEQYEVKAEVVREGRLIEKSTVTDNDGKAFIPSLVWLGADVNITVTPASETLNPRSHHYRDLLTNEGVSYVDRSNESTTTLVPVEKRKIILNIDKINPGLPFQVRVDYTAVSVGVTDALGRALPGAWIALIDVSSSSLVAWSYTNGSGHTPVMNVPVSEGERKQYWVEAYYLGEGLEGKPVWPFGAYGVWPCVYNSRLDDKSERFITIDGLHGRHLNITTHVYETELKFFYGRRTPIDVSVTVHPKRLGVKNIRAAEGTVKIKRLPRGLYAVTAKWADITVGSESMNVTDVGQGIFVFNMNVAVYDLNLTVRDAANGRTVDNVECEIHDPLGRTIHTQALSGRLIVQSLPKGYYVITFNWISPYTNQATEIARFAGNISYLASNTEIYTETYDVSFTLSDGNGRPVSGATITLGRVSNPTNPMGEAVFTFVPAGRYQVVVSKATRLLQTRPVFIDFLFRTFSFTLSNLLDLSVRVVDLEGQPIDSAVLMLKKDDEIIASATTDDEGWATLTQTVVDNYTIEANYGDCSKKVMVRVEELQESSPIVIGLPVSRQTSFTTETSTVTGAVVDGMLISVAVVAIASALVVVFLLRRRRLSSVNPMQFSSSKDAPGT